MLETRLTRAALVTVVALALGACATTPPGNVVPIADARSLAGKWVGTLSRGGRIMGGATMDIADTGTDKGTIESVVDGQVFTATFRVKDGKAATEASDGRLGTMTLYDRGGKQVLSTYTAPGVWGEYTRP
jgi:hypothetical protein